MEIPLFEKETKLRNMMNFIGIKPFYYYLGNYLADLTFLLFSEVIFIASITPFKIFDSSIESA